jgi:hypothetical protein
MKKRQPIRRGRVADQLRPVEDVPIDQRIFSAMHLLRQGKSAALVAIDARVRLTIQRVKQIEATLEAVSLL